MTGPLGKERRRYAGFVVSLLSYVSEDSQFPSDICSLLGSVLSQNSLLLIFFLRCDSPEFLKAFFFRLRCYWPKRE